MIIDTKLIIIKFQIMITLLTMLQYIYNEIHRRFLWGRGGGENNFFY